MKKLMCATAILASFAAIGAFPSAETQPNAISFEGYTSATALQLVNGVNEYDEDGTQELFSYFFFEGDTDASTVKTFGGDNLAAPTIQRPFLFADATPNDRYLEVDTASGTLWRSFGIASGEGMGEALEIADEGTYVDTLMQFSPVPATVPFETGAEDKLALRLQIDTSGGTPVTNLIVRAAYVNNDGTETSVVATNYTLNTASPVVPGQWYRLTVKALADVTKCKVWNGDPNGFTGFEIYLDGVQLAATTPTFGTGYMAYATDGEGRWLYADLDEDLIAYLQSGKVFPSLLGATTNATVQAIGFQGEGAVDDIVMADGTPFPPAVAIGDVNYDSLEEALAEALDGDTLTLLQDITLTQGLVFDSSTPLYLTLDLGGHTLSYPTAGSSEYMITVDPENWLIITNGTLTTTGRGAFVKGELDLLADTSLAADCRAINIVGVDNNTNMPAVCFIDAGATVTHGNGDDVAIFIRGSSGARQFYNAFAYLDVYGTIVDTATTPGQYGITGNGGNATLAEINFYEGSVYTFADTTRPMMWLPSNDLNLYGGTLTSAGGGIFVLCGKVNVPADSTVSVTATGPSGAYGNYNNCHTGDAFYFAATGTRYPRSQYKDTLPEGVGVDQIEANIAGGTFTSENGEAIAAYTDSSCSGVVALTNFVSGGLYSSEPAAALLAPKHLTKTVSDPAGYYTVYRWLAGSGTAQDPFQIADRDDLEFFRDQVNNANALGTPGQHFLQLADIDLGGDRWVDIGNINNTNVACFATKPAFSGVYDGGGHVVSNFVLSGYSYCGFFGAIIDGTVKNLRILDVSSPVGLSAGAAFCGDIEGSSLVENVTVSGTVNGSFNVGGFSSWAQDNITMISCTNLANVSSLTSKLGGLHPYFTGTLICSNCCNKGDMTFIKTYSGSKNNDGTAAVGGLLGYQAGGKATFLDCVNGGSINATYAAGVVGTVTLGGFVGRAQSTTGKIAITNGVNSGTIATDVSNTNEQAEVGGFIGYLANGASLSMDNVTVAAGTQLSATVKEGVTPYVRAFVGRDHSTTQTAILTLGVAPSEYAPGIAADIAGGYNSTSTADGLTTYFIEATFSVDWDTDADASAIWGTTAPTAAELESIKSWATTNNIVDPNGKLGLESYLLGCTSRLTVDPVLHIDAIEQTATGWTIKVSASAGEAEVPLSSAINGTLKVRYATELTGPWTEATYAPTFDNGQATVTVTAEGAKFMKAAITR